MRHAPRWLLVLCLAALPAARAAEIHWSGEEISDKFAEVDRKLRTLGELTRSDQRTSRRFAELEDSVRELRSTVRKLERELTTLNTTLAAIQRDLSALAAAQRQAVEPGGPTEPGKGPEEPEGPLAEIVGDRRSSDGQFVTVTGTVQNVSGKPLTFCVVEAAFLDARGQVVKTAQAYTNPRVLGPGARGSFKIMTRDDRRIRRHRLTIRTQ